MTKILCTSGTLAPATEIFICHYIRRINLGNVSMKNYKKEILDKLCYTELVYGRINKKLKIELSKDQIEEFISTIISETDDVKFEKTGKNIYITNYEKNVRLTINSHTNRIITADKLKKIITNG